MIEFAVDAWSVACRWYSARTASSEVVPLSASTLLHVGVQRGDARVGLVHALAELRHERGVERRGSGRRGLPRLEAREELRRPGAARRSPR